MPHIRVDFDQFLAYSHIGELGLVREEMVFVSNGNGRKGIKPTRARIRQESFNCIDYTQLKEPEVFLSNLKKWIFTIAMLFKKMYD